MCCHTPGKLNAFAAGVSHLVLTTADERRRVGDNEIELLCKFHLKQRALHQPCSTEQNFEAMQEFPAPGQCIEPNS